MDMQVTKILFNNIHSIPKTHFTAKINGSEYPVSDSIYSDNLYPYRPIDMERNGNNASKVFEGMTKKEIDFILDKLSIIATTRGCPNRCLHCYASAQPIQQERENFVSRMPYEDYVNLINSISNIKYENGEFKTGRFKNINMYFDSDCMELGLFDKSGKFHDFTDLHKVYFSATGDYTLFDTAGWNYKQPKMQERAEKYVDYLFNNKDKFYQINLSLSPFSPLYAKAMEYGYNPQKYSATKLSEPPKTNGEKLYREYIERTANMLFTFTPLTNISNFGILVRPTDNKEKNMQEFSVNAYKTTRLNVLNRLYQRYKEDLAGEQKYIKSEETAMFYLQKYMDLMNFYETTLVGVGRYKDLYESRNPNMTEKEKEKHFSLMQEKVKTYEELKENPNAEIIHKNFRKFINTDGRVYLFDTYHLIPTELQVKLSTNGKATPALTPKPVEDFVITREMINGFN